MWTWTLLPQLSDYDKAAGGAGWQPARRLPAAARTKSRCWLQDQQAGYQPAAGCQPALLAPQAAGVDGEADDELAIGRAAPHADVLKREIDGHRIGDLVFHAFEDR